MRRAEAVQVDLWEAGQSLVVQPEQVDGKTLYETNRRFLKQFDIKDIRIGTLLQSCILGSDNITVLSKYRNTLMELHICMILTHIEVT